MLPKRSTRTRDLWGALHKSNEGFMGLRPKPRPLCVEAPLQYSRASMLYEGFYGALPHSPHAFLKKAWEKAFFADKYPTHFIRAMLVGFLQIESANPPDLQNLKILTKHYPVLNPLSQDCKNLFTCV